VVGVCAVRRSEDIEGWEEKIEPWAKSRVVEMRRKERFLLNVGSSRLHRLKKHAFHALNYIMHLASDPLPQLPRYICTSYRNTILGLHRYVVECTCVML